MHSNRSLTILLAVLLLAMGRARAGYISTDLGTLGGSYRQAFGINNAGQVVGRAALSDHSADRAFLYDGVMRDLGTLGGNNSGAFGINDAGHVVGYAQLSDGTQHAFLYDGTM